MPQAANERRLLERGHEALRWENQPAIGYAVNDLDETEIWQAGAEPHAAGQLVIPWISVVDTFRRSHHMVGDMPTETAVVAFAREPYPNYPQGELRMERFRSVTKDGRDRDWLR